MEAKPRRFTGRQIMIMFITLCVAVVAFPTAVWAATTVNGAVSIVDGTHANNKATVSATGDPIGALDAVTTRPDGLEVQGWAIDQGTGASIQVRGLSRRHWARLVHRRHRPSRRRSCLPRLRVDARIRLCDSPPQPWRLQRLHLRDQLGSGRQRHARVSNHRSQWDPGRCARRGVVTPRRTAGPGLGD